jgi:hypothetical protein
MLNSSSDKNTTQGCVSERRHLTPLGISMEEPDGEGLGPDVVWTGHLSRLAMDVADMTVSLFRHDAYATNIWLNVPFCESSSQPPKR